MDNNKKKNNRRQFLKNTSLSLLSFSILPNTLKSKNIQTELNNNKSISKCNTSNLDYYGQGPFYTSNSPTILMISWLI